MQKVLVSSHIPSEQLQPIMPEKPPAACASLSRDSERRVSRLRASFGVFILLVIGMPPSRPRAFIARARLENGLASRMQTDSIGRSVANGGNQSRRAGVGRGRHRPDPRLSRRRPVLLDLL